MKKKICSLLLALLMVVTMLPVTAMATASNDYTQWRQGDSEWNQEEAWPASQYPNASMRWMRQAGCLVTSVAMLLRHYNVVVTSDVNTLADGASVRPSAQRPPVRSISASKDGQIRCRAIPT